MDYKARMIGERLRKLIENFAVVIVSGARQVGKSTLLQHELPHWQSVVFSQAVDVGDARRDPDLFLDNHPAPLILDEIQYAPELVPAIKRRIDRVPDGAARRTPGQYVLTGSQQWSVLKTAGESLAGRAVFIDLEGFSLAEIAQVPAGDHWLQRYLNAPEAFVASKAEQFTFGRTLYEQLWRGFLPEADSLGLDLVPDFYRGYLRTYIERDVRLISDVADWQQFGRFVQLAAALTAQEINHSQFGRELAVTPQTAKRWLAILHATFQYFELPAYHGNTVKRISGKPKGYIADTGLACNLQVITTPQTLAGHPLTGALFETAVVNEVRKLAATMSTPPGMHHWRTRKGAEVDLLLERDGVFFPIEVKLTTRPTRGDARGIVAFRDTYPHLTVAPGLVIAPIDRVVAISEHDYAVPWNCA